MKFSRDILKRLLSEIQNAIYMDVTSGNGAAVNAALGAKYKEYRKVPYPITNPEFVYRTVKAKLNDKKRKGKELPLLTGNFEILVHALGYKGIPDFINGKHPAVSTDLKGCEGFWYSYVRCNSGQPFVLRAPVEIVVRYRDVEMELRGSRRTFKGKMKLEGDCIFCLLESGDTKNLHLIFKTGLESTPNVLQGVFSGLSTANDPIAGREILIRQPGMDDLKKLTNDRLSIDKLLSSGTEDEKIIARYFSNVDENILKAGRSSNFEITDLIKPEQKPKTRKK